MAGGSSSEPPSSGLGTWLLRLGVGAFALLLALSLASFSPSDPSPFVQGTVDGNLHNWCGVVGSFMAGVLQAAVGAGAWILPPYLLWECWPTDTPPVLRWIRRGAWLLLALVTWTVLGALAPRVVALEQGALQGTLALRWGGALGAVLWPALKHVFGPVGLPLLLAALGLVSALVLAPALTRAAMALLARWMGEKAWPWLKPMPAKGVKGFLGFVKRPFLGFRRHSDQDIEAEDLKELQAAAEREDLWESQREALLKAEMETADLRKRKPDIAPPALPVIHSMNLDEPREPSREIVLEVETAPTIESLHLDIPTFRSKLLSQAPPPPTPKAPLVDPQVTRDRFGREVLQAPLPLTEPTPRALPPLEEEDEVSPPMPAPTPLPTIRTAGPVATPPSVPDPGPSRPLPPPMPAPRPSTSLPGPVDREELPPRRLFDPPSEHQKLDPAILDDTRDLIQRKLAEFKVKGQVTGYQPGPVVTVYEFQPDPGMPLSRILNMEEDLALALQAEAVRMDRIPGRAIVGIEVPNPKRETITFREIIDSPAFREPGSGLLTMALGKDISGTPIVADLAKMPHLLIGGSTGSGKSVGVNAMICSILVRALPSEVKLILIDPKMVEMGVYENIPHLWAPVVTDMKEAGRLLKWVVAQMEDRYRRLALMSVRNLEQFNQKMADYGGRVDLSDRTPNPRWPDRPKELETLPYVVVVIDELADLMMVARSEVEESIARIAQKARAVGIHLVLATQRPSVDILTGVIKANLPSRLSYRVNTKIDSRTILDGGGGEQLLGKGDALFLAPGSSRPRRVHAPYLTETETLALVNWLKERGRPDYNQALMQAMETDEEAGGADDDLPAAGGSGDDMYDRAVAVVIREKKASTSLLQRKLNLGYGRAARIIDRMEAEGIIGPDRGAGKPREVLMDSYGASEEI